MREFLLFAQTHRGYTFEQTLDLFRAEVGARVGVKPWQLQQAASAARIYRYQYRRATKDEGSGGKKLLLPDEAAMLGRLREVIRLRHYAKSTEKTYLHWTRRSLAYRLISPRALEHRGCGWPVQESSTRDVSSLVFSPDGETLASTSRDKTIKLWDVTTGNSTVTLEGHTDLVSSVVFSPDGKTLASGSRDKTIKLWDMK